MLCELGYKEIEVSFPSASQADFDFTRRLVETPGAVPDDVWLQALSPCREELITRTVESLKGAKNALLHIYLATSECFRRIVFGMTEDQSLELAVKCTKYARSITIYYKRRSVSSRYRMGIRVQSRDIFRLVPRVHD
jgi:2-isopropylmalate synthase